VFDEVTVTQSGSATAATTVVSNAADGADAVNVVIEAGDTLKITDARVGQAGAIPATSVATGKKGGDGIELAPKVDSGSDVANLTLVGNADVTGGAGSRASATDGDQTGGDGGMGINASNIETLNLHIVANETTADTITVRGGAGGGSNGTAGTTDAGDTAGTAGADVTVGTNAKIVLTDELTKTTHKYSAVDLGTVKGTNVEIDGSALDAALTVTAGDGNVKITGGAKNDVLKGGTGQDTLVGNAGDDDLQGNAGVDTYTGGAGKDTFSVAEGAATGAVVIVTDIITDFETGLGTDTIDMANTTTIISDVSATDVSGAVSGTTDLKATVNKGIVTLSGAGVSLVDTIAEVIDIFELVDATDTIGAIEAMGNTYVIANDSGNIEEVVQLTGLTGVTAISTTDAADTILIA
jgi:Ca2+-binding RTX toxin-like protein